MASNPTVLFSIGAWILPSTFHTVRNLLAEKGISSEAPAHPSIGAEPPNKTLADDVASLRSSLTKLVETEGKDVTVVAHSYGGVVASAAVEGLAKKERETAGQKGGVIRVVYVAAFVLDKGMSLFDTLGGQYQDWMKVDGDYVRCDGDPNVAMHDLTPEDQKKWQAELQHISKAVFSGVQTYESWHRIPTAYVLCEDDRALPLQFQEAMAAKMGTELMYRLKSSHSPFLSMPEKLVDILEQVVYKSKTSI
ncbi:alpha/beta hydrolase [Aspergillus stella-maris]|uniref:alpha/beta hydrolase n=1 Tax=Aspergillus stella-maris TaxID=1810926 RepID=UPI003CCC9E50